MSEASKAPERIWAGPAVGPGGKPTWNFNGMLPGDCDNDPSGLQFAEHATEYIRADIARAAPTVKPLEWEECDERKYLRAYDPELRLGYEIQRRKDGTLYARGPQNDWMPSITSDEEALKLFMWGDYARRILSALK